MKIVENLVKGRRNFIANVSTDGGNTTHHVYVISDNPDNTDTENGEKIEISEIDVHVFLQGEGYTVYDITTKLLPLC